MSEAVFCTRITELLGIRHPILCGGLMWLADANYVAAAVNAGAMGFLSAKTFPEPARFRAEIGRCRELTGGRPFGVNLYLSPRREHNQEIPALVEVLIDEGVRIVETAGLPPGELVAQLRAAGCTVIHKVSTVRHAVSAQKLQVDAVSVVGMECGGHPGLQLVGTMVQTPLAAQRVELPFAVGGGIGHGSQISAALAMGADAVVIGTRMLVAEEIWAHPLVKQRMLDSGEGDTRLVMASFRNTYRALDNDTARQVAALEAAGEADFEAYRPLVAGTLQKQAYEEGDPEKGVLSVGQSVAFADEVKPLAAIVDQLIGEAAAGRGRLDRLAPDRLSAAQ